MRALLASLLFVLTLVLPGYRARAGNSTWSGAGANNNWSTGGNWGGTAPLNDGTGDLTFAGTTRLTPNADVNWNVHSITFSTGAGAFTIGGNQITLQGAGLTNSSTSTETINNAIVLGAAQNWGAATGNLVIGGNVNNAGYLITFNGNLGTTINGAISGGGGLTQNGTGTVTLTGNNSYTGVTTISKGTVQFAKANSLYGGTTSSWTAANIIVSNGATVAFNVGGTGEFTSSNVTTLLSNLTTVSGNGLAQGSSIGFDTTNAAGGTFTIASNITDSTGGGGGKIGVTKLGSNTLVLSGNNTYSNGTTISAGALNIQSNTALGSTLGAVTVASGAQLQLQNGISVANNITISGNGISNDGALRNISGSNTLSGSITLNANSYIGATAGTLTLSGAITGGGGVGLTIVGSGTVVFSGSGNNNYTGTTEVQSGATLLLSKSGGGKALAGPLTIDSGALVQYGAANQAPAVAVTLNGTGHLDLNGYNETTNGGLTFTGGNVTTGAGVLTLSGGAANITSNASSSTATISGNLVLGTGTFTVASGTTATGVDLSVSAAISGNQNITKAGAGLMTLSGTNTNTGHITINAGTLQFAKEVSLYNNTTASWTAANLIVASGATAAFNVGGTGEFTSSDLNTLKALGTSNGGFESGSLLGLDTTNASGGTFTYSSNIANTNSGANVLGLTKLGTGTLVLSGANTYTGGTNINAGTLNVGSAGAIGSSGTISFGGGTLQYSASNTTDYSSRFSTASNQAYSIDTNSQNVTFATALTSSGGSLTKLGSGTLTLNGINTFTGNTTINGGTLVANADGALGSTAQVTVNTGGTLLLGTATASNNRISNTAVIALAGGTFNTGGYTETVGKLTLSSNSTLDLGSGTSHLTFNGASSLGSSVLTVLNWSGVIGSTGGTDQLLFQNSSFVAGTVTNQILFDIGGTMYNAEFETINGNTVEAVALTPVPEPSTIFAVSLLVILIGYRERRRLGALLRNFLERVRRRPEPVRA